MKSSVLLLILSLLVVHAGISTAADKKAKDLPPGLRKKQKLPPGWEKKQGKLESDSAPGSSPSSSTSEKASTQVKTPREAKAQFQRHLNAINQMDQQAARRRAAMHTISKELSIPLTTLQAQRRNHPDVGTTGLVMANLLSKKTGKPAGQYLRARKEGKPWEQIIADQKLEWSEVNKRLATVEASMKASR